MWIVYQTRNLVNGKIYIGVHGSNNSRYLGSGTQLIRAIEKYGRPSFIRETLFECSSREEAYFIEKLLVNEEFVKRRDTYNSTLGGYGGRGRQKGYKHSTATRSKMSASMRGIPKSDLAKEKLSKRMKGKTHTEESKRKISVSCTGRRHSEEAKAKIAKAATGRKHTAETKAKLKALPAKRDEKHPAATKVIFSDICFSTIKDAIAYFSITRPVLRRWAKEGKCHFIPPNSPKG